MKLTINSNRKIYASKGTVDDMIRAFNSKIKDLEVDSATDIEDDFDSDDTIYGAASSSESFDFVTIDDVLQFLSDRDYDIASDEAISEANAAADYINKTRREGISYSIDDWFHDTELNYPEELEDIPMI